jgi:hypothetical protein
VSTRISTTKISPLVHLAPYALVILATSSLAKTKTTYDKVYNGYEQHTVYRAYAE